MHTRISTTNNLCESELSLHFFMVPFVVGWKVVALWSMWHAHNFALLHLIIISKKKKLMNNIKMMNLGLSGG